ncbi:MAG: type II toxin-antitoxin system Phd/YefM family antitoxin [Caldilineaceae bacterium]|nr:type II toxin-antitoxin system Phd/YefM family antitoxin [Caldilineaceae bacterium]MBP8107340.1 type II toxin-antitoxin system Phd/YefM family antitoxin [Caldilineaceae bacterium]MBP8122616.1 type II toxin-antitoxin system Phd/YefM family antitoxin [Caldilineaceae bacterium]MBP9071178.1 type II toxin-antitoxin system Phd/YefM family antitoxin [Caldilineaceae bacterium]
MPHFTIQEAQENLQRLIALAQNGEEVFIADGQNALVQLIALPRQGQLRVPGQDEGRLVVPDDFDDPLPDEILESFGM